MKMKDLKLLKTVCIEMSMTPKELKMLIDEQFVTCHRASDRFYVDIDEVNNFYRTKVQECNFRYEY